MTSFQKHNLAVAYATHRLKPDTSVEEFYDIYFDAYLRLGVKDSRQQELNRCVKKSHQ